MGETGKNVADVNGDGVVNIEDLIKVAGAVGNAAGAPALWGRDLEIDLTRAQVHQWLREARKVNLNNAYISARRSGGWSNSLWH